MKWLYKTARMIGWVSMIVAVLGVTSGIPTVSGVIASLIMFLIGWKIANIAVEQNEREQQKEEHNEREQNGNSVQHLDERREQEHDTKKQGNPSNIKKWLLTVFVSGFILLGIVVFVALLIAFYELMNYRP